MIPEADVNIANFLNTDVMADDSLPTEQGVIGPSFDNMNFLNNFNFNMDNFDYANNLDYMNTLDYTNNMPLSFNLDNDMSQFSTSVDPPMFTLPTCGA